MQLPIEKITTSSRSLTRAEDRREGEIQVSALPDACHEQVAGSEPMKNIKTAGKFFHPLLKMLADQNCWYIVAPTNGELRVGNVWQIASNWQLVFSGSKKQRLRQAPRSVYRHPGRGARWAWRFKTRRRVRTGCLNTATQRALRLSLSIAWLWEKYWANYANIPPPPPPII